eukprot:3469654-Ditylum_brightwellii.AAC.1
MLNMITWPAEYPIPRCNDAVMYRFGKVLLFVLMDVFLGYHQIRLSPMSKPKTAFYAPRGRKYVWKVILFGLRNCPVVFLAFMHNMQEQWEQDCEKKGIKLDLSNGSTVIMDDTFLYAVEEDIMFAIMQCVDVNVEGNRPAQMKMGRLKTWKEPVTPQDILFFIGFAIFYMRWIPFFEIKLMPLQDLAKEFPLDHRFGGTKFNDLHWKVNKDVKPSLLSKPIMQGADPTKKFYLKTNFSAKGLGFALCQPSSDKESLAVMEREKKGGECEFDIGNGGQQETLPLSPWRKFGSNMGVKQMLTIFVGQDVYADHRSVCPQVDYVLQGQ